MDFAPILAVWRLKKLAEDDSSSLPNAVLILTDAPSFLRYNKLNVS